MRSLKIRYGRQSSYSSSYSKKVGTTVISGLSSQGYTFWGFCSVEGLDQGGYWSLWTIRPLKERQNVPPISYCSKSWGQIHESLIVLYR